MRWSLVALLALLVGALLPGSVAASDNSLGVIVDPVTQEVGAILPSDHFLPGDVDPTSLVVTDTEVADTGQSSIDAMSSLSPTIVVDDDKVQCPNAQFTSIQAAVTFAPPGSTILVCPGEYKETVLVTKALTIVGVHPSGWTNRCQAPTTPDPTTMAILHYPTIGAIPDIGFNLAAQGITVAGFFVEPLPGVLPSVPQATGIFTLNAFSGYRVLDNVVQHNTQGVYPNSNGAAPTYVVHNCLRDNNRLGAASGNGVYSDEGLINASISDNFFTLDQNAAIVVDTFLAAPSNLTISNNSSVDDSSIAVFHVKNSVISKNFSLRSAGSAIYVGGDTNGLQITQNRLRDGQFNGISIHDDTSGPPGPNTNLLVSKNDISGFNMNGIRLQGVGNTDTVQLNRSQDNQLDGLHAAGLAFGDADTSMGFLIKHNTMRFNTSHDCFDGTAGPLNQWVENKGFTQNQPGLCKHGDDNEGQEDENQEGENENPD